MDTHMDDYPNRDVFRRVSSHELSPLMITAILYYGADAMMLVF